MVYYKVRSINSGLFYDHKTGWNKNGKVYKNRKSALAQVENFKHCLSVELVTLGLTEDVNSYEKQLKDLLAIIHRDGGHHTHDYGVNQSVNDAIIEINRMRLNDPEFD